MLQNLPSKRPKRRKKGKKAAEKDVGEKDDVSDLDYIDKLLDDDAPRRKFRNRRRKRG